MDPPQDEDGDRPIEHPLPLGILPWADLCQPFGLKKMVTNNFPDSNVSGTLRVPPANGTRSVPDTFNLPNSPQFLGANTRQIPVFRICRRNDWARCARPTLAGFPAEGPS